MNAIKPTHKKWIKIGAVLVIVPIALLIYAAKSAIDGQMPAIYNYVPVWSGVFVLPTYILGMIIFTIGLIKRKKYRVANGLPLLRPVVIYLFLSLFLLIAFAGGLYFFYTKIPDIAGQSVDIAEVQARTIEVSTYILGALAGLCVMLFLIIALSGFRMHQIIDK